MSPIRKQVQSFSEFLGKGHEYSIDSPHVFQICGTFMKKTLLRTGNPRNIFCRISGLPGQKAETTLVSEKGAARAPIEDGKLLSW